MRIDQIKKINLASENDRVTNGMIDFFYSLLLASLVTSIVSLFISNYIVLTVIFILTRVLYYTISEYFFKVTLGKLHTKTMVVSRDSKNLVFKQVFKRNVIRLFTALASVLEDVPTAYHDSLSNTYVIKSESAKQIPMGRFAIAIILFLVGLMRFIYMIQKGFDIIGFFILIGGAGLFYYKLIKKD